MLNKPRRKDGMCPNCGMPRMRNSAYCKQHQAEWAREYRKRNSPSEFWKVIDEKDAEIERLKSELLIYKDIKLWSENNLKQVD